MIGAAETSYFVDSIKKKVDLDLQITQDIAGRAAQTAQATELIAANAERAEVDQGLQHISNAQQMPQLAYAGAVDNNGYFPAHNRKFSKPLTGNYDTDLMNNRTKRIFSDRTGARCDSNTKPFLLQTYKRDTGEVMHDLSVPIYVNGKHWGGFRIGYRSSTPVDVATANTKSEAAAVPRILNKMGRAVGKKSESVT